MRPARQRRNGDSVERNPPQKALRGGIPGVVLGAIRPFLDPFYGHLSPKIDKVSWKLTFEIPPRRALCGVEAARLEPRLTDREGERERARERERDRKVKRDQSERQRQGGGGKRRGGRILTSVLI